MKHIQFEYDGNKDGLTEDDLFHAVMFAIPLDTEAPNALMQVSRMYYEMLSPSDESTAPDLREKVLNREELLNCNIVISGQDQEFVYNMRTLETTNELTNLTLVDRLTLLCRLEETKGSFNALVGTIVSESGLPVYIVGKILMEIIFSNRNEPGYGAGLFNLLNKDFEATVNHVLQHLPITEKFLKMKKEEYL